MAHATDVVIIGGGLVGASLALALEPLELSIDVLESIPFNHDAQPSFDERTIALTFSSRRVFEAIGIWSEIATDACPIHSIHVSDQGHFGSTHLDRSLINTDALGYVVPSRTLGHALLNRLQDSITIRYHAPAVVASLQTDGDFVNVQVNNASGDRKARLAVLADGGRSPLGQQIGIRRLEKSYPEVVLVAMVATDQDHQHRAYERFTQHGPLALLPAGHQRFALAWTLPETTAKAYAELSNEDFLSRLQMSFGERAGVFCNVGKRNTYAVGLTELYQPVSGRVVAIGNAAHIVHPVAGQGFNLGLRDVAELAENLFAATEHHQDLGSMAVLSHYADHRRAQTRRVQHFTDGLLRIFSNDYPGLNLLRSAGLQTLDMMPGVKRHLLRRTAGLRGPLPRLARGLPLCPN